MSNTWIAIPTYHAILATGLNGDLGVMYADKTIIAIENVAKLPEITGFSIAFLNPSIFERILTVRITIIINAIHPDTAL